MRALVLPLALALPFGLAACNAEPEPAEVTEDYQEDVQGPVQEEVDQELTPTRYGGYDTDSDGLLSNDEYDAGVGDGAFTTYDTDADGYLNDDEYGVYEDGLTM